MMTDFDKCPEFEYSGKAAAAEMDSESNGSSAEETESPRSVVEKWNNEKCGIKVRVHNQILRIRAEDLQLGEDVKERILCGGKEGRGVVHVMVVAKQNLPASPLGGGGRTAAITGE